MKEKDFVALLLNLMPCRLLEIIEIIEIILPNKFKNTTMFLIIIKFFYYYKYKYSMFFGYYNNYNINTRRLFYKNNHHKLKLYK